MVWWKDRPHLQFFALMAQRNCQGAKIDASIGAWRSLVAHLHGVQGAPGSNPGAPTEQMPDIKNVGRFYFSRP